MANDNVFSIREVQAEVSKHKAALAGALKAGDGGGTSGGMEARIDRLESDMAHVKDSLSAIRSDNKTEGADISSIKVELARMDERIKALPSKGFIFVTAAAMVGSTAGIVTLIRYIMN